MGNHSDDLNRRGTLWPFLASISVVIGMSLAAWAWCCGPEVASPYQSGLPGFSARSAIMVVENLTGDGIPHPAGTGQNDLVRQRLERHIQELGIEFEIQHTSHHPGMDVKRPEVALENVLFRIDADDPASDRMLVMILSHYDSTANGPGASDAASGVSVVLEIARLVKMTSGRKHDVLFLITDGEESGLLGADRFLAEHPLAGEIDLVINLEARGTSGPSLMFQTGPGNLELVRLMARHLQRPYTGSLFDTVYRRLPNGTDFTLFMNAGIRGFNFAYIKNANHYHTPDDNAANLDMRSLQHHGDNAWQLTRALIQLPERLGGQSENASAKSAVWFDLLGWKVIWWPEGWSIWICLAAWLVLLAGWRIQSGSSGDRDAKRMRPGVALVSVISLVAVSLALNSLIEWGLRLDDALRVTWPLGLVAPTILVGFSGTAVALLTGWFAWRKRKTGGASDLRGLLVGCAAIWLVAATAAAFYLPGAVYLFLVPGLVSTVVCCLPFQNRFRAGAVTVIPVVIASLVWLWLGPSLFDAIGFRWPIVWPLIVAWLATCLVPSASLMGVRQSQWICAGSVATALAAVIVAVADKS